MDISTQLTRAMCVKLLLSEIEHDTKSIDLDIPTFKDREAIKKVATKVARSKTHLDRIGNDLTAELRKQPITVKTRAQMEKSSVERDAMIDAEKRAKAALEAEERAKAEVQRFERERLHQKRQIIGIIDEIERHMREFEELPHKDEAMKSLLRAIRTNLDKLDKSNAN